MAAENKYSGIGEEYMDYKYRIYAEFPTRRDKKGKLKLTDSTGTLKWGPVDALGRGSDKPENDNNHTNWMKKFADVPTGEYETTIVDAKPGSSYGLHRRIWLNPALNGNAKTAEDAGRDQIMIHGGDLAEDTSLPWYPLRPTCGCIRLSDSDQKQLIEAIEGFGSEKGIITITNV